MSLDPADVLKELSEIEDRIAKGMRELGGMLK